MLGKAPVCAVAWAFATDFSRQTSASLSPAELVPNRDQTCTREGL
jgi:hypothetical protein